MCTLNNFDKIKDFVFRIIIFKLFVQLIIQIKLTQKQMIQGSKPKKFITKTILTNPSLYSLSVTSLFDPNNINISKVYEALQKKQNISSSKETKILNQLNPERFPRQASYYDGKGVLKQPPSSVKQILQEYSVRKKWDSLQLAEKHFEEKKINKPEGISRNISEKIGKDAQQKSYLTRGNSLPSLFGFNYSRSSEIKEKQSKPFNIINNM